VVTPFPEYLDFYLTLMAPARGNAGEEELDQSFPFSYSKTGRIPIDRVSTLYILACRYNVDSKNDADRNRS
jgi:hypothetical protein